MFYQKWVKRCLIVTVDFFNSFIRAWLLLTTEGLIAQVEIHGASIRLWGFAYYKVQLKTNIIKNEYVC